MSPLNSAHAQTYDTGASAPIEDGGNPYQQRRQAIQSQRTQQFQPYVAPPPEAAQIAPIDPTRPPQIIISSGQASQRHPSHRQVVTAPENSQFAYDQTAYNSTVSAPREQPKSAFDAVLNVLPNSIASHLRSDPEPQPQALAAAPAGTIVSPGIIINRRKEHIQTLTAANDAASYGALEPAAGGEDPNQPLIPSPGTAPANAAAPANPAAPQAAATPTPPPPPVVDGAPPPPVVAAPSVPAAPPPPAAAAAPPPPPPPVVEASPPPPALVAAAAAPPTPELKPLLSSNTLPVPNQQAAAVPAAPAPAAPAAPQPPLVSGFHDTALNSIVTKLPDPGPSTVQTLGVTPSPSVPAPAPAAAPTPSEGASEPARALTTASKDIANRLPGGATDQQKKSATGPLNVDHVKEQPGAKTEEAPQNASHESAGMKLDVQNRQTNWNYELQKAYDALIAGNTTSAIEIYKKVLANNPNNPNALFGLATTYHRAGQLDLARPLYAKLLAIEPGNRDALNNFLVMLADEAPEEALGQLQKLEDKSPDFSPIPAQMAVIYERMGNTDKASEKMFRAISLSPENLTYRYNLAIMLDKQKKYDEAAKLYKQLVQSYQRGEVIPGNIQKIQERLTFISSNRL